MLQTEHVVFKEPDVGDMVLFFKWHPRRKRYETDVGIIVQELDEIHWVISEEVRNKEQILFVLNLEGYRKQLNSHTMYQSAVSA